ncbi:MAG: tetratricopeptide repeat protein [bacterium]|jgi:tetratricopeptide (TPR) repeat protein|nr:tetratricopeptide repeat protein [candidate division KSB1 bacterium]MDH7561096.1 tetratricopeptide repeat protein [bacterium]
MRKYWLIAFLVVCLPVALVLAQGRSAAESVVREGNSLYERGDYQGAVAKYQQALASGFESGALYFNLGNAYYRLGDIGRAILNYERARRLLPEDEEVRFNLELANLKTVDHIVVPPKFILFRFVESFKDWLAFGTLFRVVMGLYLIVVALVIGLVLDRPGRVHRPLRAGLWLFGFLLVLFAVTLAARLHEATRLAEAVVLEEKVAALSGPGEEAAEQFFLHAGAKVRIEEVSGSWCRIRLPDGKVGWLPAAAMERI